MSVKNELTEDLFLSMRRKVGKLPPDAEDMNNARAEAAFRAVRAFSQDFGEDIDDFEGNEQHGMVQQNLSDLLSVIAHLSDRLGLNLIDLLNKAKFHYDEETDNVGEQFQFLEIAEGNATVLSAMASNDPR